MKLACNASYRKLPVYVLDFVAAILGIGFGRSDFWDCWVDER